MKYYWIIFNMWRDCFSVVPGSSCCAAHVIGGYILSLSVHILSNIHVYEYDYLYTTLFLFVN